MLKLSGYAVSALIVSSSAYAFQETDEDPLTLLSKGAANASQYSAVGAPPTQPGFAIIGASPENVVEPGSFADFSVGAASFFDDDGDLRPGAAIEFKPFWVLGERSISLERYQTSSRLKRVLSRASITGAAVEGASSDDGARVGLGVYTELLDAGDPRMDKKLSACIASAAEFYQADPAVSAARRGYSAGAAEVLFSWDLAYPALANRLQANETSEAEKNALRAHRNAYLKFQETASGDASRLAALRAGLAGEAVAGAVTRFDAAVATCRKSHQDRARISSSWVLGFGAAFNETEVDGEQAPETEMVWTGARIPFRFLKGFGPKDEGDAADDTTALNIVAQYSNEALVDGPNDEKVIADQATVGLSLTESRERLRLDLGVTYNFTEFDDNALDRDEFVRAYVRAAAPVSVMGQNAWLEFGFGGVSNAKFEDEGFLTIRLTFAGHS